MVMGLSLIKAAISSSSWSTSGIIPLRVEGGPVFPKSIERRISAHTRDTRYAWIVDSYQSRSSSDQYACKYCIKKLVPRYNCCEPMREENWLRTKGMA